MEEVSGDGFHVVHVYFLMMNTISDEGGLAFELSFQNCRSFLLQVFLPVHVSYLVVAGFLLFASAVFSLFLLGRPCADMIWEDLNVVSCVVVGKF